MGLIRRSFQVFTLGLVRGRSRKQRVALKHLRATRETNRLLTQQQRDYGSGYDRYSKFPD